MYLSIADSSQKEKIEKYLKRMGVSYVKADTIEQLYVKETVMLVSEIIDNMPFQFLKPKKASGGIDYGKQQEVINSIIGNLMDKSQEIALEEPLFIKLNQSIVKKCEEALFEKIEIDTEKKAV